MSLLSDLPEKQKTVLVLAGPGNNGGDALEMATLLADSGISVSVLLVSNRKKNEPEEARLARQKAIKSAIHWEDALSIKTTLESLKKRNWSLVVDGMFGIGLKEALTGNRSELVETVNTFSCPVLALDVPSGLNADTGNVVGQDAVAIKATHTITFLADKPGLHTGKGRDYAGQVHIAPLDVDKKYFPETQCWLNSPKLFNRSLPPRLHDTHKGSYGRIAVVGGADGMAGAPVLAARAALYTGSGLCYAIYLKNPPVYDPVTPELMFRAAHQYDFSSDVIVIGPGLGKSPIAREYVGKTIESGKPALFDADALNILAESVELQESLADRSLPSVITPHPLEAARLLGTDSISIQSDRLKAAMQLATKFNAIAILKGSGTVICSPDGKTVINPTGNPGLATAGTGDVLSGITGSLIAQGLPAWEAALAAVWLHGKAADILEKEHRGCIGITAGEIALVVRNLLNECIAKK
jgi:hydroxyethylthiazole kinase-like uncharacterized protein yjeF